MNDNDISYYAKMDKYKIHSVLVNDGDGGRLLGVVDRYSCML